jgi:membrane-anchored protein YejM (alkaline phosphatase superfamily)
MISKGNSEFGSRIVEDGQTIRNYNFKKYRQYNGQKKKDKKDKQCM